MVSNTARPRYRLPRRRPVAAAFAGLFVVATPALCSASTWTVDNTCGDDISAGDAGTQTGTLRFCTDQASNFDTIDLSHTTCSTISAHTGAIAIAQSALVLHGPGKSQLAITGYGDRVFDVSTAASSVTLDNLTIAHGLAYSATGSANGGCIRSVGSLTLDSVAVYHCSTYSIGGSTLGGGVYAQGTLTIKNSSLRYNSTNTTADNLASQGGGAAAIGPLYLTDSTVSDNSVHGKPSNVRVFGGGLTMRNNVTVTRSLIARNFSTFGAGGIDLFASVSGRSATFSNSTVTQNDADGRIGGIESNFAQLNINNSTIVANTAASSADTASPGVLYAAGVGVRYFASSGPIALTLQSSIIANNTSDVSYDLSIGSTPAKVTILASNNLVRTVPTAVLPSLAFSSGNQTDVCPLLGPLRDNGGPTLTHALHSGSPAIDHGGNTNDPITHALALYDQRGSGHARVSGGTADIGAYEVQLDDIVFNTDFDACQ